MFAALEQKVEALQSENARLAELVRRPYLDAVLRYLELRAFSTDGGSSNFGTEEVA